MADPKDKRTGIDLYRMTEEVITVTQTAQQIDVAGCEYIELVNKSASDAYFRADTAETTATAGASGNGDILTQYTPRLLWMGKVTNISIIADSGITAYVFVRKYT